MGELGRLDPGPCALVAAVEAANAAAFMSHTGIRLRITLNGQPVLDGDSDFLHMCAVLANGLPEMTVADVTAAADHKMHQWFGHQCQGGFLEIGIQPVNLPDEYPDDEDQAENADEHAD